MDYIKVYDFVRLKESILYTHKIKLFKQTLALWWIKTAIIFNTEFQLKYVLLYFQN